MPVCSATSLSRPLDYRTSGLLIGLAKDIKMLNRTPDGNVLFTPRISARSDERLNIAVSDEDYSKMKRGGPWRAEITDLNTGKRYLVRGAACGCRGCRCDAVIVKDFGQLN
jgi:hypothetical protein